MPISGKADAHDVAEDREIANIFMRFCVNEAKRNGGSTVLPSIKVRRLDLSAEELESARKQALARFNQLSADNVRHL